MGAEAGDPLPGIRVGADPHLDLLVGQGLLDLRGVRRGAGGQVVAGVLDGAGGVQELELQLGLLLKSLHRVLGVGPILAAGIGGKAAGGGFRPALQVARGGGVVVAPDGGGEGGQGQHQHQQHHAHAVDEPAAADAPDLPLVRDLYFFGHVSTSLKMNCAFSVLCRL